MKLNELKDVLNAQIYFVIDKRIWGKGLRDTSTKFYHYEIEKMLQEYGEREVKAIEGFDSQYNGLKVVLNYDN